MRKHKMETMMESVMEGFQRDIEPLRRSDRPNIVDELRSRAGIKDDTSLLEAREIKLRAKKLIAEMHSLAEDMGIVGEEDAGVLIAFAQEVFGVR
jgi:hypothetical protein